jgi:hypothetical protein
MPRRALETASGEAGQLVASAANRPTAHRSVCIATVSYPNP